jgi:hypothetical protein
MVRVGSSGGAGAAGFEPEVADTAQDASAAESAAVPAAVVRGTTARRPAPGTGASATPRSPTPAQGASVAVDRAAFERLARRDDVPGALGVREVKFLMTDVDTPNPKLYLINTNNIAYHYDFATKALGVGLPLEQFNAQTYFTDRRKFLAGTILAHDNVERPGGGKGMYAMEFWPTDPVKAEHVAKAFKAVERALPFAKGAIAYHPAGETQEALFAREKAQLRRLGVASIDTETLMKNVSYQPLNPGVGYGVLRVVDGSAGERPPGVRDVVIFKRIPNDISHVGGVITEEPQTPLSHVNLKAKQNDTPNAYVKDASKDPKIAPLIGKLVRYEVGPDGFKVTAATEAEAAAYLDQVRPRRVQHPPRDLTEKRIRDIDDLTNASTRAYGAKAANVGELRNVLARDEVPDGYGIPFHFYDSFMKKTGLYDEARRMMADPRFKSDDAFREQQLRRFQRRVRDAEVPPELRSELRALQARFPAGTSLRCRSSTNNEDLPGFNGAGLYDSYTHRPDEGGLENTVKQVWASLWNFRAFEEREFYRIPHLEAAMGVLVHPNFDDEEANGVAVTRNVYDPNWPGFYVNVQVGEELVTNPEGGATPDEFLVSAIGERGEWETQFVRRSNQTRGKPVLTKAQTQELVLAMEKIQAHFKKVYKKENDPNFAMDIEFKIGADGKLVVKQARPYVE